MENFDHSELYEAEMRDLITRLYDLAKECKLPLIVAVCPKMQKDEFTLRSSVLLPGVDRTPTTMAAMYAVMAGDEQLSNMVLDIADALEFSKIASAMIESADARKN